MRLIYFILCTLLSTTIYSGTISIDDDFNKVKISNSYEYYFDADDKLSNNYPEIIKKKFKSRNKPYVDFFQGSIWVKFSLNYNISKPSSYVIRFNAHILSEVELFQKQGDNLKKTSHGGEAYKDLTVFDHNTTVSITPTKPVGIVTYYIRIKSHNLTNVVSTICTKKNYNDFKGINNLFTGIFYGFLIIAILIGIIYFPRNTGGKYSLGLIITLFLMSFVIDGIFMSFVRFPGTEGWGTMIPIFISLCVFFCVRSTTKMYSCRIVPMDYIGNGLIIISSISALFTIFTDVGIANIIVRISIFVTIIYVLAYSAERIRNHKSLYAENLLISWGGYLLIIFIYFIVLHGFIETVIPPEYIYKLALIWLVGTVMFTHLEMIKNRNRESSLVSHINSVEGVISGIAHEVNNPLTIVAGNIDIINMRLDRLQINDDQLLSSLNAQRDGTRRISTIVDEIKNITNSKSVDRIKAEVNTILKSISTEFSEIAIKKNIVFELILEKTDSIKIISSSGIRDAFKQILKNSCDEFKEKSIGQKITIQTYTDKESVTITFKDNGRGMNEEQISKAFDYFYTTKRKTKTAGKGLGLPSVYCYINAAQGSIKISSKLGKWTKVMITLPRENS